MQVRRSLVFSCSFALTPLSSAWPCCRRRHSSSSSMSGFMPQCPSLEGNRRNFPDGDAEKEVEEGEPRNTTHPNRGGWAASHRRAGSVWQREQQQLSNDEVEDAKHGERRVSSSSSSSSAAATRYEAEMEPIHAAHRLVNHHETDLTTEEGPPLPPPQRRRRKEDAVEEEEEEPLAKNLSSTIADEAHPYRVAWFYRGRVSPSKRFVYWSYRRLRELPEEWQEYYRRMLRQEVRAARFTTQTWDQFMMVVDGYRKGKWILNKYGVPIDEGIIQKPYNNFWEETTHEERVWAHHRATQMKDLQALQRDEDSLVFGAMSMDRREVSHQTSMKLSGGMQGGTPVHALDLAAPSEEDVRMSREDEEMSSALMGSIEDDKLWNPVLKARKYKAQMREDLESFEMEDDDEEEGDATAGEEREGAARGQQQQQEVESRPNVRIGKYR